MILNIANGKITNPTSLCFDSPGQWGALITPAGREYLPAEGDTVDVSPINAGDRLELASQAIHPNRHGELWVDRKIFVVEEKSPDHLRLREIEVEQGPWFSLEPRLPALQLVELHADELAAALETKGWKCVPPSP